MSAERIASLVDEAARCLHEAGNLYNSTYGDSLTKKEIVENMAPVKGYPSWLWAGLRQTGLNDSGLSIDVLGTFMRSKGNWYK